jgi:outer membrane biosynthesis protein TonB
MMPAKTLALMALLAVSLSGCSVFHRQPPPQAPALKTEHGALQEAEKKEQQAPPAAPLPQPSEQTAPPQLPPVKPPKVKKTRKKPSPPTTPPAPVETAQAAANLPGANSPIGVLTTGDSASGEQTKHDTANLIAQTEHGLASIKQPLSHDEEKTEAEIHTFLKQAKVALGNGDTDGAHTLATKAKLLLDELKKQ